MAEALIAGILRKKIFAPNTIGVCDVDAGRLKHLKRKYRVKIFSSNQDLTASSRTILLAVKPQQMDGVLREIAPLLKPSHLLLSIAAGLDTRFFYGRIAASQPLVRIMPNLCATIGEGIAAVYLSPACRAGDRTLARRIFDSVGETVFVDQEEMLDAVTAVSGSGPAFVALFADAMIEAGQAAGLGAELSRRLVLKTLSGTSQLIRGMRDTIPSFIEKVASKGGTTEAGLSVLTEAKFRETIGQTIQKAMERAKELKCIS